MTGPCTTLIQTAELAEHLGDPGWLVVDCRYTLSDPDAGLNAYRRSRIPGARYLHLEDDLCGPRTEYSGRHPLPDPEAFSRTLARAGMHTHCQVVAYDDSFGSMAARLWWMLRWLGHEAVALLDGGFQKWQREKRELESVHPATRGEGSLRPKPRRSQWLSAGEVERILGRDGVRLVDARAPERFSGAMEPFDPVAGHIPGAVNRPWEDNVDVDGTLLPPDEIRQEFARLLGDVPPERVIHVCGSGVTACLNVLAMEVAGLRGSRLYPGSWSEWIADPRHPVALGEAP